VLVDNLVVVHAKPYSSYGFLGCDAVLLG